MGIALSQDFTGLLAPELVTRGSAVLAARTMVIESDGIRSEISGYHGV